MNKMELYIYREKEREREYNEDLGAVFEIRLKMWKNKSLFYTIIEKN